MLNEAQLSELNEKARQIRGDILRMLETACSGHPGGSLSAADLIAYLYFYKMRHDPANPKWKQRDRFVLSKGHAAPVLYAALAGTGYFPKTDLGSLRKFGCHLQGHPDMKKTPGVEISTGSLGQGLSAANGMALAARLDGIENRVFVLLGDGECQEGQVWEAAMTSVHYRLYRLTAFLDYNRLQIDGDVEDVKSFKDPGQRFKSFGWNVLECDGHDIGAIDQAVTAAEQYTDGPSLIVLHTVKGKGISFMENQACWHGVAPKTEELDKGLKELGL